MTEILPLRSCAYTRSEVTYNQLSSKGYSLKRQDMIKISEKKHLRLI